MNYTCDVINYAHKNNSSNSMNSTRIQNEQTRVTCVGFFFWHTCYTWSIFLLMFLFEELQNALGKSEKKQKVGGGDLSG